jgi:hypothetical protein
MLSFVVHNDWDSDDMLWSLGLSTVAEDHLALEVLKCLLAIGHAKSGWRNLLLPVGLNALKLIILSLKLTEFKV